MVDQTTPLLHYFESGNNFSGSDRGTRYKIFPNKETGEMTCKVWMGDFCLEKTDPAQVEEKAFPISEDGRKEMIQWINEFKGKDA